MTRLRSSLAIAAVVGAPIVGCQSTCGGAKSEKGAVVEARVELLEPGREPKVAMQVGRWTGFRYAVVVEVDSSIALEGQAPIRPPTLVSVLRFRTVRGTADPVERERGGQQLKLVEEEVVVDSVTMKSDTVPRDFLEQMNARLAAASGTESRIFVAEDGEVVSMETRRVGGVDPSPEVKRILDSAWDGQPRFPFRLPPTPVGVGARWRFTEKLRSNGLDLVQVSDMTVVQIAAERVRLKLRARQEAPQQDFVDPFRPDGSAHLDRYRGDGEGELTIDRLTGIVLDGRFSTSAMLTVSRERDGRREAATLLAAGVVRMTSAAGRDAGPELADDPIGAGSAIRADGSPPGDAAPTPPGSLPPSAPAPSATP